MTKNHLRIVAGAVLVLVTAGLAASPARAQALKDNVIIISYVNVPPQKTNGWLTLFKKHFHPALEELQQGGELIGWHLFAPGIHHPGTDWTFAIVLAAKDRAGQGAIEKKLQGVLKEMPPGQVKQFFGAMDLSKHYDDEWREVDLGAVQVPEEEDEAEEEQEGGEEEGDEGDQ